jgi:plasmid replication initiation protein
LLLASTIKPDDEDFKPVRFRIVDLLNYLGFEDNTTHYTYLRQLTEKLMTRVLKIWDLQRKTLLQINWLSSAEYHFKEGIVELCFDPKLKPFLLKLKEKFTAYSLQIAIKFDSAYSIRIYELLKQYEKLGIRTIRVEELKQYLGIEKNKAYKKYNNLKRKVILTAYEELKEKADIYFEFEEKKKGRKIEEIVFYIRKNPNFREEKIEIKENIKPEIKVIEEKPILKVQNEELLNKIKEYTNLTDDKLKRIFNSYEEKYIEEVFNLTLKKYEEGKIDNLTAFFLAGLKENYLKPSPYEEKKQKEQQEKEEQEKLRDKLEEELKALNKAYWDALRVEVLTKFQILEKEERAQLKNSFIAEVIRENKLITEEFLRKGFDSLIIQNLFVKYLIEKVKGLEPSFKNILDFLRDKNFDFNRLKQLKEKYREQRVKNLIYLLKVEERLKELKVPSDILITFDLEDKNLKEMIEEKITDYLFNQL